MDHLKVIILLSVLSANGFVHHKAIRRDLENIEKSQNTFYSKANNVNPHPEACPEKSFCVIPVQCPAHVRIPTLKKCTLSGGRQGLCCSTGQNHTAPNLQTRSSADKFHLDRDAMQTIHDFAQKEIEKMHKRSSELLELIRPPFLTPGTPSFGHYRSNRVYGPTELNNVMSIAHKGMEIALATKAWKESQDIPSEEFEWNMIPENLQEGPFRPSCPELPKCPRISSPYRSIDGSCNNLHYTNWGMGMTAFSRLLPPKYHDGIWSPRVSELHGGVLPSPRRVSTSIFQDNDYPNKEYTMMLMQFGQFVSHDVTHSIDFTFRNGSAISCCGEKDTYVSPQEEQHHACYPIHVPDNDNFYSTYGIKCMNFVRSIMAPRYDCTLGFTQQMNKITHFIDGSAVYGSTEDQIAQLRSFEGGQLNIFNDFGRPLLPLAKEKESCLTMERGSACFESGDSRANQMITLVAVHTIFMREHNRLAEILQEINPYWSDEKLFLETRRILIAELQVIIYKEFLPALLGELTMEEFDLNLTPDGIYSYDYDDTVEPSVTNEFSTAAFRFGHSTVNGIFSVYGKDKIEEMISIPEVMFYPSRMRKAEFYDEILSTLTTEPIQEVDGSMSEALTNYMFRAGNPFGVDLAAINIQRGRDHGLRPYNDYRVLVGLPPIRSFDEFGSEFGYKLAQVYDTVDDIDVWVGGLLESKSSGSILGPTFRDIIADQFSRLKRGDRYFFENDPNINPGHFTLEQLRELKKITLSRMICDNSDRILLVHQASNAFRKPGVEGNEYLHCDSGDIPSVNLMYWKEF